VENINQDIENHYHKEGLFEEIILRLTEKGIDINNVSRADISAIDELHVRGAAVSEELAHSIDLKGAHVLDVGCGLGGPCRLLADELGCQTTGIDLSKEHIRTATQLSRLVKLDDKTTFVVGNATQLPFNDNTFDAVWTQHVQMNIPDKEKFYTEIFRVLKPGGHFLYYDIFKSGKSEISYPMPWASNETQSFLIQSTAMEQILDDLGFTKIQSKNQTQAGVDFFEHMIARLKAFGPPTIGINVLMGESTQPKLMNLLDHLKQGELIIQSGIYKKE